MRRRALTIGAFAKTCFQRPATPDVGDFGDVIVNPPIGIGRAEKGDETDIGWVLALQAFGLHELQVPLVRGIACPEFEIVGRLDRIEVRSICRSARILAARIGSTLAVASSPRRRSPAPTPRTQVRIAVSANSQRRMLNSRARRAPPGARLQSRGLVANGAGHHARVLMGEDMAMVNDIARKFEGHFQLYRRNCACAGMNLVDSAATLSQIGWGVRAWRRRESDVIHRGCLELSELLPVLEGMGEIGETGFRTVMSTTRNLF